MIKEKNNFIDYITMIMLLLVIIAVAFITHFSNNYINRYVQLIQENVEKRLFAECRAVQNLVSIEKLQSYENPEDMEKEDYKELMNILKEYAEEQSLMFIYFIRLVDNKIQYIIDSDPNPETHYGLDHFEEPSETVLKALSGKPAYNQIGDYEEGWEGIISAYVPIYDENNKIIALVGVDISDEDIVERRNVTKRFTSISLISTIILGITSFVVIIRYQRKAKEAKVASAVKGDFLSKMSHEIRTPMNAIIGFCRMAKNTDDPDKKNKYLSDINTSSDYLLELINEILDVSKIEVNKMRLNIEKTSVQSMLKNIETLLSSHISKKNQKFTMNISKNIPKYVYCDEMRLKQILINITNNAIKFTDENGEISIDVSMIERKDNSCNIEFTIKDNGIGIEAKNIAKLFEAFEQADGSITRKYGGTGLGLPIAKHFVDLMKGKISVTSKINEGSTFKFNVWLDIASNKNIKSSSEKTILDTKIDCHNMIFLVAEDSEINQIIVKDILENFGANIDFANDGQECIEKFKKNPNKYKIIFMDIQMPNIDGLEATRRIRNMKIEAAKTIPIIAMTAEVFQENIDAAIKSGMNDHLGKPLNIPEIVKVIKKNLDK